MLCSTDAAFVDCVNMRDPIRVLMHPSQVRELREMWHCFQTFDQDGNGVLTEREFADLCREKELPVWRSENREEAVRALFTKILRTTGGDPTGQAITFDNFCDWVAASQLGNEPDADAMFLDEQTDATFYASIVRSVTSATRPLAKSFALLLRAMVKKVALSVGKYIVNPVRLFRKVAVGTTEIIWRRHSALGVTAVGALRAELMSGGVLGISRMAAGPYLLNTVVAVSMFQTYTKVKEFCDPRMGPPSSRREWFDSPNPYLRIFKVEGAAGFTAGTVQALLNAPLYNSKRVQTGVELGAAVRKLWKEEGLAGTYKDFGLMWFQEALGLMLFFASYEASKQFLEQRVSEPSHLPLAWVASGMLAGTLLTAASHPFDNLHEWHIEHRTRNAPRNAVTHFYRDCWSRGRGRARIVLFKGLAKRLPMGIPVGLPLLVYEMLVGQERLRAHIDEVNEEGG